MSKINTKTKLDPIYTHEGAIAKRITPELELRRSVMSCMLWENEFYESGKTISERIAETIPLVKPEKVMEIAIEARDKMKLRHAPLLIVREMARLPEHKKLVAKTLSMVIQRADELSEFLAIYWKDKKQPLSAQVKLGLASAFTKFSEYDLAKYNRDNDITLRDVLFLCHAKPINAEQNALWKKLVDNTLETPDTWEVELSAGKDKKATFERLIKEKKLGALALIRNLRNMNQSGVNEDLVFSALNAMKVDRVLPFRFISAARAVPQWEDKLEPAMFKCLSNHPKLSGTTVLIIDVSGSMYGANLSSKSEITRADTACSLGVLVRELAETPRIFATAGNDMSRIHATKEVAARRGFALHDEIFNQSRPLGGGGIFLKQVIEYVKERVPVCDRIIVITDEQDCDNSLNGSPSKAKPYGTNNYLINVASAKNGIGYGQWTHIDGFSEAVLDYVAAKEETDKGGN
jgi:60 kDa SS-A/Ro ribonucleoprotein